MGNNAKPYELEMLLFVIAEKEIYNEVTNLDFMKK